MIIIMAKCATEENINYVKNVLEAENLKIHEFKGADNTIIEVSEKEDIAINLSLEDLPFVEKCIYMTKSYKLSGRNDAMGRSINIGGERIGGKKLTMIAGPCAVESEEQIFSVARKISETGAKFLRGGAYKFRTSPYSFQGLGIEGLKLLKEAALENDLMVVSEVTSEGLIDVNYEYCDVFQIGARNMQNFGLLKAIGETDKPVILKRGISSTVEEWLYAAEHIMSRGNMDVILCERGIRTFETATRNTLDISSIPVIKEKSVLPIIVDPSHASGNSRYVKALSMAAVAAGADGLMIEVHPDPRKALSDAKQQITPKEYSALIDDVKNIAKSVNKVM